MKRQVFALVLLCACSRALADTSDSIKPGTSLSAATETLKKFGYDADPAKHQLAMIATDPANELAFCPLDEDITLVMEYQKSTKNLVSLSVAVIPEHKPKSQRAQFNRAVLEVKFDEQGSFWLKLKRGADAKGGAAERRD